LRVFSDKVPSALSTSDASTTAQPFQSIVPPAKLMLQSDFGLSSGTSFNVPFATDFLVQL
jgi:hypothetical protein